MMRNSLKERVKLYEDAFEQRYGYRPSHHQKMDDRNTKRLLTELARVRKELKQLKERHHLTDPVDALEVTETSQTRDPEGFTTSTSFLTSTAASLERVPSSSSSSYSTPIATPTTPAAGNSSTASVEQTVLQVLEVGSRATPCTFISSSLSIDWIVLNGHSVKRRKVINTKTEK